MQCLNEIVLRSVAGVQSILRSRIKVSSQYRIILLQEIDDLKEQSFFCAFLAFVMASKGLATLRE